MSEEVLTQTSFVDKNRFRTNFSRETVYVSRKPEPIRPRIVSDINSPDYSPFRQARKFNHNSAYQKIARWIVNGQVGSIQAVSVEGLQPALSTSKTYSIFHNPFRFKRIYNFIRPKNKLQLTTAILALLMIIGGAYLSLAAWQDNQAVHAQAAKLTAQANEATTTGSGKNTNNAISTVKPSARTVAAYAVAPNYPKYLKIPSIGVNAIVGQVGILSNGALGTPDNVYYTDWYTGSAEPGKPGATLIDGHVSSWTAKGVFYNLHLLKPGEAIQIVKGNNTVVNYQVVKTKVYSSSNVDMTAAITPIVPGVSGLNLITCTGDVIPGTSLFNERVIVFAKEV